MADNRKRINEVKEMVADTRCYSKLLDAIGDVIYNHADAYAEEFGTTTDELMLAFEELVYNKEHDEEWLDEVLDEI